MKQLRIDGKLVTIHEQRRVPNCGGWVRVVVSEDGKRPTASHDIPSSGKFKTNGHQYEWVTA